MTGWLSTGARRVGDCAVGLLILCGCAADHRNTPFTAVDGGPPPIPITEQLLSSQQKQREQQVGEDQGVLTTAGPSAYAIGPADVLAIVVWDHPELSGTVPATGGVTADGQAAALSSTAGFVVDHDGQIQFPYAGSLKVGGLNQEQARSLLAAKLAHFLRDPRVSLRVQAYRSQRVYVGGEVKSPGLLAIDDVPMSLLEALNRAGGLLPSADQSSIVLERAGVRHHIDLIRPRRGAGVASELTLAAGDIVHVAPRDESKVFVTGEVLAPRALTMHDGRMTLGEALGEAGGINPQSGDARQVYVVRRAGAGPEVYWLDARSARSLALAEQFELTAKDVVYVAASPLANWHRAISLLIPGELSSAVGAVRP